PASNDAVPSTEVPGAVDHSTTNGAAETRTDRPAPVGQGHEMPQTFTSAPSAATPPQTPAAPQDPAAGGAPAFAAPHAATVPQQPVPQQSIPQQTAAFAAPTGSGAPHSPAYGSAPAHPGAPTSTAPGAAFGIHSAAQAGQGEPF